MDTVEAADPKVVHGKVMRIRKRSTQLFCFTCRLSLCCYSIYIQEEGGVNRYVLVPDAELSGPL
jgi:hypothetical protein